MLVGNEIPYVKCIMSIVITQTYKGILQNSLN